MDREIAERERAPVQAIRRAAQPLVGVADDDDALLNLVGNARYVLLGEATHGTHEFYQTRAQITRRLISEFGTWAGEETPETYPFGV